MSIGHFAQCIEFLRFSVHRVIISIELTYLKRLAPFLEHSESMKVNYYYQFIIKEIPQEVQVTPKLNTSHVAQCSSSVHKLSFWAKPILLTISVNKNNMSFLLTLFSVQLDFAFWLLIMSFKIVFTSALFQNILYHSYLSIFPCF